LFHFQLERESSRVHQGELKWLIDPSDVVVDQEIGRGAFGVVWKVTGLVESLYAYRREYGII
jgi:hypothetical protein